MIRVTCLGGTGSVSGSCFLIESPQGKKVLVDCGLFQGGRQVETRNWEDWGFDPKQISTLFLTHAHIDHSGRIPKLVKDGFQGQIMTSPPTAELCEIMLLDAAHIQEMDAEWQTRKNKRSAKKEIAPLYTTQNAQEALKLLAPVERDRIIEVDKGIRARLRNAGHILGSSILELWIGEKKEPAKSETVKIVFSGDIGRKDQLIIRDPQEVFDADYLFVESTYGDRLHRSFEDSKNELLEAINYSTSHGQKVIIPAFAVERTQEILYILSEYQRSGALPDIPIYLDSPLAIKATRIFRKNKRYYDEEAMAIVDQGFDPLDMPNLHFTESTRESIAINEREGSAIVIAGNGMCTAGRIKHHLKHNLWRKGASLVIVGFQAHGTTGRKIVDGADKVKIFRENVAVEAKVFTIGGFSAHADQNALLEWVGHFESSPRVFPIHGETKGSIALAEKIKEQTGFETHVPEWKERLVLKPREIVIEAPVKVEPAVDQKSIMQDAIKELEEQIAALKGRIDTGELGDNHMAEMNIDRIKYIKEEIQTILS